MVPIEKKVAEEILHLMGIETPDGALIAGNAELSEQAHVECRHNGDLQQAPRIGGARDVLSQIGLLQAAREGTPLSPSQGDVCHLFDAACRWRICAMGCGRKEQSGRTGAAT
jgi:hypothetical protein